MPKKPRKTFSFLPCLEKYENFYPFCDIIIFVYRSVYSTYYTHLRKSAAGFSSLCACTYSRKTFSCKYFCRMKSKKNSLKNVLTNLIKRIYTCFERYSDSELEIRNCNR